MHNDAWKESYNASSEIYVERGKHTVQLRLGEFIPGTMIMHKGSCPAIRAR